MDIIFLNKVLYLNNDESIISCSSDGVIKIWNTKTTHCIYTIDNIHKLSLEQDIHDHNIIPNQYNLLNDDGNNTDIDKSKNISIGTMIINPLNKKTKKEQVYIVTSNGDVVYLLNVKTGKLMKKFESEKLKKYILNKKREKTNQNEQKEDEDHHHFQNIVASFYGNYLYMLGEPEHILYCFNLMKTRKKRKKSKKDSDLLANAIKIHDETVICIQHHPHRNVLASLSTDRTLKIWRS